MKGRARFAVVSIALLAAFGCSGGDTGGDDSAATGGSGANDGTGGSGGTFQIPEPGNVDRADVSYADNLLQKVEDGEWTLGEGLVATLQAFAGERDEADILRYPELITYEATGVFLLAREYVEGGADPDAQSEISRLLGLLEFSVIELEQMAGLSSTVAPPTTKGGSTSSCLRFFKDRGENSVPPGLGFCLEVESHKIGANEHRIFFPAAPLPSAGWDQTSVDMAVDALFDSVPVYEEIGEVPAINIVFSVANAGRIWGKSFPSGNGECSIAIFTGLQSQAKENFQQLLAHEIAHCFQGETWPNQNTPSYEITKWHYEGGAEYWSNLVYPEVNLEWGHLRKLEQVELDAPLHIRSYESFIFFQYLGSTIGNQGIADLMSMLPDFPTSRIGDQIARTADFPDMERIFHEFVQALTDGAVRDTSGELIPYTAPAYEIDLFGPVSKILEVPLLFPFATYRFLLSAAEDERDELDFRETGTMTSSARRAAEGVFAGVAGAVSESLVAPGLFPWSPSLPTELPEEECASGARMVLATTTKSSSSGASFELDVPDVDDIECCLHGRWLMNNEDLSAADTEGLGIPVTYSGQLSAEYRSDGTVVFLWGGVTRVFEQQDGTSTDVINGGGVQYYEVLSGDLLLYSGPRIEVSVDSISAMGQASSFTAPLDTGLGDFPSQFFQCDQDRLVTIIRGDDAIGWQRMQ